MRKIYFKEEGKYQVFIKNYFDFMGVIANFESTSDLREKLKEDQEFLSIMNANKLLVIAYLDVGNNQILGYLIINFIPSSRRWHLLKMYVSSENRGRGIGTLCLQSGVMAAVNDGYTEIEIHFTSDAAGQGTLYKNFCEYATANYRPNIKFFIGAKDVPPHEQIQDFAL